MTRLVVLEVSRSVSGAYCGWLLREMGAKISRIGPVATESSDPASRTINYLNADKTGHDAEAFRVLVGEADVVLTDDPSFLSEVCGQALSELADAMPGRVLGVCSVFGMTGPLHDVPSSDIDAQAVSSVAWVLGEKGRAPLTIPPEILASQAGAHLAGAILAAIMVPRQPDRARIVDVALADVLASYVSVNCRFYIHHGMSWARSGRRASDSGGAYPFVILPCKDGQVCLSGRTKGEWLRLVEALGNPAWSEDKRYQSLRRMGREYPEEVDALLIPQLAGMTKAEIAELANRHRLTISPVRNLGEVMATKQFEMRGFWRSHAMAGRSVKVPGLPFIARQERDEDAPRITADLLGALPESAGSPVQACRPLAGLRVVDLGWVWSAPQVSGYLAQLGADVIKVEHGRRIDSMRLSGTVLVDGQKVEGVPTEMSPMFHQVNRGKKGITLNLKEPQAIGLLKRLVADSGIVIENMSPGSLERAGLGFKDLRKVRPDLVMLAMSGAGQFGPLSEMRTYAPVMSSFVGLEGLIGYPGEEPVGALNFALGDPNAAIHGLAALLAALVRRQATGQGCYIDLSQTEALLAILTPFLLESQVTASGVSPRGNAHPAMSPHGIYPSSEPDGWLTISVRNDPEWVALKAAIAPEGMAPGWMDQAAHRCARRAEVDETVTSWTHGRPAAQTAGMLRAAGGRGHAGPRHRRALGRAAIRGSRPLFAGRSAVHGRCRPGRSAVEDRRFRPRSVPARPKARRAQRSGVSRPAGSRAQRNREAERELRHLVRPIFNPLLQDWTVT